EARRRRRARPARGAHVVTRAVRERGERRAHAVAQRVVEAEARPRPLAARLVAHRADPAPLEDGGAPSPRRALGAGRAARCRTDSAPRARGTGAHLALKPANLVQRANQVPGERT